MNRRSGRRSRPIVLALSLAIVLAQALPAVADTVQADGGRRRRRPESGTWGQ